MRLPLVRVGNSLCLRMPRPVLASLKLKEGDGLFLSAEENRLVLSRDPREPKVKAFMNLLRPMLGREIFLVYLFGSFLTPKWRPEKSDIDLYVVVRNDPAVMKVVDLASRLDVEAGPPPLGPVVLPLRKVDWTWFEDEVMDGIPLYVDPRAFPRGVPPQEYLREVEAEQVEAET